MRSKGGLYGTKKIAPEAEKMSSVDGALTRAVQNRLSMQGVEMASPRIFYGPGAVGTLYVDRVQQTQ